MESFEHESAGLRDYRELAELLGIPPEAIANGPGEIGGAGPVTVSQMFDEANRELLTASEMKDSKRLRIIAKTLRWLQFLEKRSQSLTENAQAFLDRWTRDSRAPGLVSKRENLERTVERLEWSLAAMTRWIERRFPLARRGESGARLNIHWQVAGGAGQWEGTDDSIPLREVVRECLVIDGGFPAERAEPIADQLLEDLRQGSLWLPRLTRTDDSTSERTVLCYESLGSRVQPAAKPTLDEEVRLDTLARAA